MAAWKPDPPRGLGLGPRHRGQGARAPDTGRRALPSRGAGSAVRRAGSWRRGRASARGARPRPPGSTGRCCSGPVSGGTTTRAPPRGGREQSRAGPRSFTALPSSPPVLLSSLLSFFLLFFPFVLHLFFHFFFLHFAFRYIALFLYVSACAHTHTLELSFHTTEAPRGSTSRPVSGRDPRALRPG